MLDYFTNESGEKTNSDEKVEQMTEVRRKSRVRQTLRSP